MQRGPVRLVTNAMASRLAAWNMDVPAEDNSNGSSKKVAAGRRQDWHEEAEVPAQRNSASPPQKLSLAAPNGIDEHAIEVHSG